MFEQISDTEHSFEALKQLFLSSQLTEQELLELYSAESGFTIPEAIDELDLACQESAPSTLEYVRILVEGIAQRENVGLRIVCAFFAVLHELAELIPLLVQLLKDVRKSGNRTFQLGAAECYERLMFSLEGRPAPSLPDHVSIF